MYLDRIFSCNSVEKAIFENLLLLLSNFAQKIINTNWLISEQNIQDSFLKRALANELLPDGREGRNRTMLPRAPNA